MVAATLVVGAVVLAVSLRIRPGDATFYWATSGLAATWICGAIAGGPVRVGWARTRAGTHLVRPVIQPLVLAALLLGVFSAGAVAISAIPTLDAPVVQLLDHAREGYLPFIVGLVVVNGIAEELFFRGALYAAVPPRHAIWSTAVLYAGVTAASGIVLLGFAGLILGVVTALQRRVTGGLLAPIITHIVWTLGMLVILPVLLHHVR